MTDNRLQDYHDKCELVGRFNHWKPQNKQATILLGITMLLIAAAPVIFITYWILTNTGYSPCLVFWFFPLAILMIPLHELIHFVFQWIFSKKRPQLGFKCPYPYSKLRRNSSISRNQGLISALSPLVLVTVVFIVTALFVNPIAQVALIIPAYLHASICSGDLVFTSWLIKHPKDTRLKVEDFETVIFRNKSNTRVC